ncbi:hypothetical protein QOT17_024361 [Balamuthia mandrillaris]
MLKRSTGILPLRRPVECGCLGRAAGSDRMPLTRVRSPFLYRSLSLRASSPLCPVSSLSSRFVPTTQSLRHFSVSAHQQQLHQKQQQANTDSSIEEDEEQTKAVLRERRIQEVSRSLDGYVERGEWQLAEDKAELLLRLNDEKHPDRYKLRYKDHPRFPKKETVYEEDEEGRIIAKEDLFEDVEELLPGEEQDELLGLTLSKLAFIWQNQALQTDASEEQPPSQDSLNNPPNAQHDVAKLDLSRKAYDAALRIMKGVLGADHPDLGPPLINYADVLAQLGKVPLAEEMCKEALPIFEKHHGERSEILGAALSNLGGYLCGQEKLEEACPVVYKALGIMEECLGRKNDYTLSILRNLLRILKDLKRDDELKELRAKYAEESALVEQFQHKAEELVKKQPQLEEELLKDWEQQKAKLFDPPGFFRDKKFGKAELRSFLHAIAAVQQAKSLDPSAAPPPPSSSLPDSENEAEVLDQGLRDLAATGKLRPELVDIIMKEFENLSDEEVDSVVKSAKDKSPEELIKAEEQLAEQWLEDQRLEEDQDYEELMKEDPVGKMTPAEVESQLKRAQEGEVYMDTKMAEEVNQQPDPSLTLLQAEDFAMKFKHLGKGRVKPKDSQRILSAEELEHLLSRKGPAKGE